MKKKLQINSLAHTLRDIVHASPMRLPLELLSVISSIVNSLLVQIVFIKLILDYVVVGSFLKAILFAVIAGCLDLLCSFYNTWMQDSYRPKDDIRLRQFYHERLYRYAARINIRLYDDPEYYDRFILAARSSDSTAVRTIASLNDLLTMLGELLFSAIVIIQKLPELFFIVLVASLLYIFFSSLDAKQYVNMNMALSPIDKRREYVKRMFFTKRQALDIRTTGVPQLLYNMLHECKADSTSTINRFAPKRVLYHIITGSLFYGQIVSMIVLLAWHALILHDVSVGVFSVLMTSSTTLCNTLRFWGNTFSNLLTQGMMAENYNRFLKDAEESNENKPTEEIKAFDTLRTDNVTFKYFDDADAVFSDLSVQINKGQKVAIVGSNGSGKTTLINLILNLYRPQKGTVLLNDTDIDRYSKDEYRTGYALIFQDVRLFPFTIIENLLLQPEGNKEDETRVWKALQFVGLEEKIRSLPLGLMTPVSKEFNSEGVVFSGGEIQRMALARAILQDTAVYIMDEPTSSLDPKQELQVNKLFAQALQDKTVLLVSHRLSTIVGVDYIYVIGDGSVKEAGTHEELMAINGLYARIYRAQSELYWEE